MFDFDYIDRLIFGPLPSPPGVPMPMRPVPPVSAVELVRLEIGDLFAGRYRVIAELPRWENRVVFEVLNEKRRASWGLVLLQDEDGYVARTGGIHAITGEICRQRAGNFPKNVVSYGDAGREPVPWVTVDVLRARPWTEDLATERSALNDSTRVVAINATLGQVLDGLDHATREVHPGTLLVENGLVTVVPMGLLRLSGFGAPWLGAVNEDENRSGLMRLLRAARASCERADDELPAIEERIADLLRIFGLKPADFLRQAAYLAPEVVRGEAGHDRRADLYSAGAVLYEILTGEKPVERSRMADVLETPEVVPVEERNPGVDPHLAEMCRRLMAPEPGDRFDTAEAAMMFHVARPRPRPLFGRKTRDESRDMPAGPPLQLGRFRVTTYREIQAVRLRTPAGRGDGEARRWVGEGERDGVVAYVVALPEHEARDPTSVGTWLGLRVRALSRLCRHRRAHRGLLRPLGWGIESAGRDGTGVAFAWMTAEHPGTDSRPWEPTYPALDSLAECLAWLHESRFVHGGIDRDALWRRPDGTTALAPWCRGDGFAPDRVFAEVKEQAAAPGPDLIH